MQFRHHQNYAQSSQNRLWPLQKHSLAAESHTTAHDADKDKLEAFSRATMAQHDTVKLSFRDVMVNKGDASKFGRPGAARRSVLDKAMVTPSILTCTKSKGLARQFGARRLLFVDGSSAARLDCSIGRAVVNIQLRTRRNVSSSLILLLERRALSFSRRPSHPYSQWSWTWRMARCQVISAVL